MRALRPFPLFAALLLAGCYAYVPLEGAPDPGAHLRVELSTAPAVRVSERLGRITRAVDGIAVRAPSDSIALSLWQDLAAGPATFTPRDTLRFARAELVTVQERRFSRGRTALFAGGAALLAAGVVAFLWDRVGGSSADGGDGSDF